MSEPLTVESSTAAFQRRWREIEASPGTLRPISVAIVASFTVDTLVPYVGCFLAQRGLHAQTTLAPFGQIYQTLLDPCADVRGADITIVMTRLEDLCARSLSALASGQAIDAARTEAHAELARFTAALASFEAATTGTVLVGTLPLPPSTPLGMLDASHPGSVAQLGRELNVALWTATRASRRIRLFDLDAELAQLGGARAWDSRMALLSGCPLSALGLRHVGYRLARTITPLFISPAKVIVLDLDNTLWGGIVGEDGASGIHIGTTGIGAGFAAFQDALLAFRAQGVLLAIASKNNEADAFEIFDHHPGMKIRREHLAAHRISWAPKSESLRELAQELSLGVDSFVFLDDSPTECAEVKRVLPEVTVVQLPADVAHYVDTLRAIPQLDRMSLTDEDRMRADAYTAEKARTEARAAAEHDPALLREHLKSLELVCVVRRVGDADVPRTAQLTQKTNQFNLTTIRRSEPEIEAMRRDPAWRLYTLEVRDRFGDYGLTGLVFANRANDTTWHLDTVLLSCRVLGRGVESAFLRAVTSDLVTAGAKRLTSKLVPTKKNVPVRDYLPRHGFVEGEAQTWSKELPGEPFDDDHISLQFSGTVS